MREGIAAITQLKGSLKTAVLYRDDQFGRAVREGARVLEAMPPWHDPDFDVPAIDFSARDHLGLRHPFLAQIRHARWERVELPPADHANVNQRR